MWFTMVYTRLPYPTPWIQDEIISNIMFLWSEMMQRISPQTIPQNPIRQWRLSAAAWVPLLGWVLWSDPRAPPPRKRSISGSVPNPIARCKHGCIFEVAPKTRPTWCGLGQGEHAHVHYRFNIRKRQDREVLPQPTKHTHTHSHTYIYDYMYVYIYIHSNPQKARKWSPTKQLSMSFLSFRE